MTKLFIRKNRSTGNFYKTIKTVAYDREVLEKFALFLPQMEELSSSEERVCLTLFQEGRNKCYRLFSNTFATTGERFTGIHKVSLNQTSAEGSTFIVANSGINLGEQEMQQLARWFPHLRQMLSQI